MPEDTIRVFVYGTLKVGGKFAPRFDADRISCKKGRTKGTMYKVNWFPGVLFDGKNILHGEVHEYTNPKEVESRFDRIEGCYGNDPSNLYNKVKILVLVDGEEVECMAYEFNQSVDDYEVVENGVWEI